MLLASFVILVTLPVIELIVLFKVGGLIGFLPLLALLVVMALAGSFILRSQGIAAMQRGMAAMARGEPPVGPMVDGLGLGLAGFLLILPGFLTDIMGLALLVPPVRRWVVGRMLGFGRWTVATRGSAGPAAHRDSPDAEEVRGRARPGPDRSPDRPAADRGSGIVIDGEFERLGERTVRPGERRGPGDKPDPAAGRGRPPSGT